MSDLQSYFENLPGRRDRRRHKRKAAALNYVTLGEDNGGILLDLGEGGLSLVAAETLRDDSLKSIRFQLGEDSRWLETTGRIVWLTGSRKGAGVLFVNLTKDHQDQIRRWVLLPPPPPKNEEILGIAADVDEEFMALSRRMLDGAASEVQVLDNSNKLDVELVPSSQETRNRKLGPRSSPEEFETQQPVIDQRDAAASSIETPVILKPPIDPPLARHPVNEKTTIPESAIASATIADPITTQPAPTQPPEVQRVTNLPGIAQPSPRIGLSILDLGYQSRSEWAEPENSILTGRLHLLTLAILAIATSFAIGLAFGRGYVKKNLPPSEQLRQEITSDTPIRASSARPSPAGPSGKPAPISPGPNSASTADQTSDGSSDVFVPRPNLSAVAAGESLAGNTKPANRRHNQGLNRPVPTIRISSNAARSMKNIDEEASGESLLVSAPGEGAEPLRVHCREIAVSASASIAMSSQCSALVLPAPGLASAHSSMRLHFGRLISHVEPDYTNLRIEGEDTLKLQASVDENGHVAGVVRISGPAPLLSAAATAVRQWRFAPTFLDGHPIETQEEIKIEFRKRSSDR